jgi:hypothetical protein
MAVKNYDPDRVSMIFGPVILHGLADGSFLTVEYNEDAFTLQVGSDGESCRSRSNNNSARVTFKLGQWSNSNDLLSGLFVADLLSGVGVFPLLIKDNNGTTLHAAETAWITKFPTAEFDREAGSREWVIETDSLQSFVGGAL